MLGLFGGFDEVAAGTFVEVLLAVGLVGDEDLGGEGFAAVWKVPVRTDFIV